MNRTEWLQERRKGIGASDAAAVLGISPWKSRYTLYQEKIGEIPLEEEMPEYVYWGSQLEPAIREHVEKYYETSIGYREFRIIQSRNFFWMLATLDGEFPHVPEQVAIALGWESNLGAGNYIPGVLEIKTASAYSAKDWSDEEWPLYYQVQCQHQLAVTGYTWGVLAVLIGGQQLKLFPFERNQKFIDGLIREEARFWQQVENRTPPELDGTASTAATLRRLYPEDDGSEIELPAESLLWDAERREAQQSIKEQKDIIHDCEAKLKAAIGKHTYGVLPDGGRYAWKTQEKRGYYVDPCKFRVLRRMKDE